MNQFHEVLASLHYSSILALALFSVISNISDRKFSFFRFMLPKLRSNGEQRVEICDNLLMVV